MCPALFAAATMPRSPVTCKEPPTFVHQQKVGSTLDCKRDGLGLAGIQSLLKVPHSILIFGSSDDQPRDGTDIHRISQVAVRSCQLVGYGGRDENLIIQGTQ